MKGYEEKTAAHIAEQLHAYNSTRNSNTCMRQQQINRRERAASMGVWNQFAKNEVKN